jgi:hypothetical protein
MGTYNKNKAIELYNDFKELTKVDLFSRSKETKTMTLRSLFFKILKDNNFMNDREISEFFAEMGDIRNRSSIYHSLTKMEHYYSNFGYFRQIYDLYFYDLKEHYGLKEQQKKVRLDKVEYQKQSDKLDDLINTVECKDRREELYEMVNLRIKSWAWKVRDRCQIIEGAGTIEGVY